MMKGVKENRHVLKPSKMEESKSTGDGLDSKTSKVSANLKLCRRLSRRLSLVAKMPTLFNPKQLKNEMDYSKRSRSVDIVVIAPDKTQRNFIGNSNQTIGSLVSKLIEEFGIRDLGLSQAGSLAQVDPHASVNLLEGDILIVEDKTPSWDPRGDDDPLYRKTEEFLAEEKKYLIAIRSAKEIYGDSLHRLEFFLEEDYKMIFNNLSSLAETNRAFTEQIACALEFWESEVYKIGRIFSDEFLDQYEDYLNMYGQLKRLLQEKYLKDEEFVEFSKLRQGATVLKLEDILHLPVQRLAHYEQYLSNLLDDPRTNHDDITAVKSRVKQAVKRRQEESDLDRIQDLFPNDSLRLYDRDVLTMKMKGLMSKRSGTAARLQRALSSKSLHSESPPSPRTPTTSQSERQFIMEAPVQFWTGVQSQERHLFLFNDLLLVAKARSGGNFKLKEKVRVSELWLTKAGLDDVAEIERSVDTSFVIGWPTTNVIVSFSTQAARNLWWSKLTEVLTTEKSKEPCSTNIQVLYYDLHSKIDYCKTFSVGPDETVRDCIRLALDHLEMRGANPSCYQLWAKTAREEAPYPLIGHERPFAIKLSCLREDLSSEEGFDLDYCNNIHDPVARCHFILRSAVKNPETDIKKKKSPARMKIGQVFRRSHSKENPGCLFGLPLTKIMIGDELPRPVMAMLQQVHSKGPFTQGIFRKSANAKLVRDLREKLDGGEDVLFDHVPVLVTAALLKDFLRSLPDPLLVSVLYPQWKAALDTPNIHHKLLRLKGVLQHLPRPNYILLSHFICVLHHIARRSSQNLMSSSNLGVCVGPSLLWNNTPHTPDLRTIPALVDCLITHCELLLGSQVPQLLGDPRDSGTEESDSLRRDDSSIDSLECSPPPRKDKISLSRDSGLTMSDSQLYTPDEEESSSSSSGYDPAFDPRSKLQVTTALSMPSEYVRVYGGWEERLNPNFQRQAWFRQRSRRLHSVPIKKEKVRRSASEESLLESRV